MELWTSCFVCPSKPERYLYYSEKSGKLQAFCPLFGKQTAREKRWKRLWTGCLQFVDKLPFVERKIGNFCFVALRKRKKRGKRKVIHVFFNSVEKMMSGFRQRVENLQRI